MTKFSTEQLEVADAINQLKVGEGIEFASSATVNAGYVERESAARFKVNGGNAVCFVEACLALFVRALDQNAKLCVV